MAYGNDDANGDTAVIPDHVPNRLVHRFDQWNDPEYLADPMGGWDALRSDYPVFWSPLYGGYWCLTRYQDIHEAFQRPDMFSSRTTNIPGRTVRLLPISLDPPEHQKYRRILNRPFSPGNMEILSHKVAARCAELIDAIEGKPACEFMDAFAKALPTATFCEMLGLPAAELPKFLEWNHVILHVHGEGEGAARQQRANDELQEYLKELVGTRSDDPGDDLIGQLLTAEVEGDRLNEDEVLGMAHLLFMAGLDTVTASLGWAWHFLAANPGHRQQILDDPSIIPDAVEELLRFHSIIEDSRTVVYDFEFAGVQMREGDRVLLPTTSASRDPEAFPNPLTVDFHREPNRHLAFAAGPHRCVGSHLARMELRTAIDQWHQRIPHYRLAPQAQITYQGGAVVGPIALDLELGVSA